jgi:hypothetical protein
MVQDTNICTCTQISAAAVVETWRYYILGFFFLRQGANPNFYYSSSFHNSIVQKLLARWHEKMVPNHFINKFMFYVLTTHKADT